ncbi:MAG: S1/P1 nuclease [Bdellovibrionota bacterium]|nr:S1/P1 nuclease [Bdellovibrionota bacterium]
MCFFKILICFSCLVHSLSAFSWGELGHRLVGEVALENLTATSRKEIAKILAKDTLADISSWPDRIKSKKQYRKYSTWHYCTVKDGEKYSDTQGGGSLVVQLKLTIAKLKQGSSLPGFSKRETLAWLVHLVGDLHQPLHVGRPGDKGGNKIIVSWFGKKMNLHRLWDSEILKKVSKDESSLLKEIGETFLSKESFKSSSKMRIHGFESSGAPEDWANESVNLRSYPYDMIEGSESRKLKELASLSVHNKYLKTKGRRVAKAKLPKLGISYFERNKKVVMKRIAQAGLRLATLLNEIYDRKKE